MSESVAQPSRKRTRFEQLPGTPAQVWLLGAVVLLIPELGAVLGVMAQLVPGGTTVAGIIDMIPVLLSRETIPNQGAYVPGNGWQGPFLGLSPAQAWGLRVVLVYVYSALWIYWLWQGYKIYKRHYRSTAWSPFDDVVTQFSYHRWGQFGLVVVLAFLVLALFAPVLAPTTMEQNVIEPYSHEITYYDAATGDLETITVGDANLASTSQGIEDRHVGPLSYDQYDRFHPFGTLPSGQDLFTQVALGARVSLLIGLTAILVSGIISTGLARASASYGGIIDLGIVLLSDATQSLPQLLVVIMLSVVLSQTWLAGIYNGALLLALIFAFTGWPSLWRAIRGPALQISERTWIDAADSYGTPSHAIMRRHMFPYIIGYLLVYASMNLGGIIIGAAGLSFLGLGISPPTPEWGRLVNVGQPLLTTMSWHIAVIPGVLIVIIVTAFNALGDGVRDAIDAKTDLGDEGETTTAASGAGG